MSDAALRTERVIRATPERISLAFSDPNQLARWWGPNGFSNTFHQFDFRSGGAWRFTMHGPDGKDYANECVFVEVALPARIVVRHDSQPNFTLTITFEPQDDSTLLRWVQAFEDAATCAAVAKYAGNANEQVLDRLEAVLAG
jgi:uncharacterized protein YndB with AHSA1/START domain